MDDTDFAITPKPRRDARRFQVEPTEFVFEIEVNKAINVKKQMKIFNYLPSPIYFVYKSTAISELKVQPPNGVILAYETIKVFIVHNSSEIIKSVADKKSRNRITFCWLPVPVEIIHDMRRLIAFHDKTPIEDTFIHTFYVNYVVQDKNDLSSEMVYGCRTAISFPESIQAPYCTTSIVSRSANPSKPPVTCQTGESMGQMSGSEYGDSQPAPITAGTETTEGFEGYLVRKYTWKSIQKKSNSRSWVKMYTELRGNNLIFFKDQRHKKDNDPLQTSSSINLADCLVEVATGYTKKKHVFSLKLPTGAEYLFHTNDDKDMGEWMGKIQLVIGQQFAAGEPSCSTTLPVQQVTRSKKNGFFGRKK